MSDDTKTDDDAADRTRPEAVPESDGGEKTPPVGRSRAEEIFPDIARAEPRSGFTAPRRAGRGSIAVWVFAGVLSFLWIAAVLSFVWGYYGLPLTLDGFEETETTLLTGREISVLVGTILGGICLIWLGAALLKRTHELGAESLALRAATAEMTERNNGSAPGLPSAALVGEVTANPAHIRREVERATHAISALHTQMRSIEEALARQSAAIDGAAERAESRARAITESLKAEREALQSLVTAIEEDGGRALSLTERGPVGLPLGDAAEAQATLDALKAQSDSIEKTVEQTGARLSSIAAEIQNALGDLRQVQEEDRQSDTDGLRASIEALTDDARSSIRAAAQDAIGSIGAAEASVRRRLTDADQFGATDDDTADIAIPAPRLDTRVEPGFGDSDAAAELRRAHLAELRRQVERLRDSEDGESTAPPLDAEPEEDAPWQRVGAASTDLELDPPRVYDGAFVDDTGIVERREIETGDEASHREPAAPLRPRPAPRGFDWTRLVQAANFPDGEDDSETVDALYEVLTDPDAAAFLQTTEDALAALYDLGVYVEDHETDLAPLDEWRALARGDTPTTALAGLEAPADRERVRERLSRDPALERLAGRFANRYEDMLRRLFEEAGDDSLALRLAETRSGRAYMIIADAAGRFA